MMPGKAIRNTSEKSCNMWLVAKISRNPNVEEATRENTNITFLCTQNSDAQDMLYSTT